MSRLSVVIRQAKINPTGFAKTASFTALANSLSISGIENKHAAKAVSTAAKAIDYDAIWKTIRGGGKKTFEYGKSMAKDFAASDAGKKTVDFVKANPKTTAAGGIVGGYLLGRSGKSNPPYRNRMPSEYGNKYYFN